MSWMLQGAQIALVLLWSVQAKAFECDSGDTALEGDLDQDGWTPAQGDCNDCRGDIYPGANENCHDDLDNNCDGFFNEGCDLSVAQGEISGGGGCANGRNLLSVTGLLGLGLLGGRRRDEGAA
jgi:hypothetical protein